MTELIAFNPSTQTVLAPISTSLTLSSVHHQKIIQVNLETFLFALSLPSSPIFGFNCVIVVVKSGQDLSIIANNQTPISWFNDKTASTTLAAPAVGTRLRIQCDGSAWYAVSDYYKTLPSNYSNNITSGQTYTSLRTYATDNVTQMPILLSRSQASGGIYTLNSVGETSLASLKGRLFKVIIGNVSASNTDVLSFLISTNFLVYSCIKNCNDTPNNINGDTNMSLYIGDPPNLTPSNRIVIGDSFTIVCDGTKWYVCGSSFGKISESLV